MGDRAKPDTLHDAIRMAPVPMFWAGALWFGMVGWTAGNLLWWAAS